MRDTGSGPIPGWWPSWSAGWSAGAEAWAQIVGSVQGVFERFTDRARRVLVLAQEEARLLNHSFIGTEHILLGLIGEGDGLAAQALSTLGITPEAVRRKVEETIGMAGTAPSGSPPFTPRAKKVLELSLREALQLGHSYIGTEHILLGLVREGEGVAATVLVGLGADLGRVRHEVVRLISGHEHREHVAYPSAGPWASTADEPRATVPALPCRSGRNGPLPHHERRRRRPRQPQEVAHVRRRVLQPVRHDPAHVHRMTIVAITPGWGIFL